MIPTRELGHHAPVLSMNIHLRIQRIREQAVIGVVERHAGLVTARFYSQYPHFIFLKLASLVSIVFQAGNHRPRDLDQVASIPGSRNVTFSNASTCRTLRGVSY
jgi:hypothetical protein